MKLTPHQQELANELVGIIGQINTGRDIETIRRLVEEKIEQLTAQEPFYLMTMLEDDQLTPFEKA